MEENPDGHATAGTAVTRLLWAASLIAGYLALDWASALKPLGPFSITPWNPQAALAIVWMAAAGLGYFPAVVVATFLADIGVRGAPGGLWISCVLSLILAAGYVAIAIALKRLFGAELHLRDARRLWILTAIATSGAAMISLAYIGALHVAGFVKEGTFFHMLLRFWLGEAVGVLVTTPLLLVATDAVARDRLWQAWHRRETLLQFCTLLLFITVNFNLTADPSRNIYLLFLPFIWIALRGGLPGAALASVVTQFSVVIAFQSDTFQALSAADFQARIAILVLTGLFLGVIVDERERTAAVLRQSMRLAAAGEMAGAIAHELNQPLAALANYASACRMMLRQGAAAEAGNALAVTIDKISGEASRAGEVISRLREFFRTGSTRLEETSVSTLLQSASRIGLSMSPQAMIRFEVLKAADEGELSIDRLLIELVLRNVLANAFEAVAQQPPDKQRITVSSEITDSSVIIRIVDSGPGISPGIRRGLFEPFATSKSSGMGLGLSISQAIVQAHGGTLAARYSDHGEFHLLLPLNQSDE